MPKRTATGYLRFSVFIYKFVWCLLHVCQLYISLFHVYSFWQIRIVSCQSICQYQQEAIITFVLVEIAESSRPLNCMIRVCNSID